MDGDSHLGFEILGGVTWSVVDDLVDVRNIPGKQQHKAGMTPNSFLSARLKYLKGISNT